MKKRNLIIVIFILLALPIPVAVLGCFLTSMWLLKSLINSASTVEIVTASVGVLVAATYVLSYIFALVKTCGEKRFCKKSFLPLVHCMVAFIYLVSLNPISKYIYETTERFGFAIRDFSVVEQLDTHGGFHGDGSYYLILDCSDNKEKALGILEKWNKLPLSQNLNLIMYGGEKDGVNYGYKLAEEAKIPMVENGYYIFEDRSAESKDSTDDSELFDRGSFNFSIAIYDCDTHKMYYFEFDT